LGSSSLHLYYQEGFKEQERETDALGYAREEQEKTCHYYCFCREKSREIE